jgi:peroxiredoxin
MENRKSTQRISLLSMGLGVSLCLSAAALSPGPARAEAAASPAQVGSAAPDFTLTDVNGKAHHLRDYQGKKVVLEWFNPDCPFVKFAHTKGPLKDMGNRYSKQGVVWLAINSGSPGKQGAGLPRNKQALTEYGIAYPVLLDESGTVGKSYGAKSTPHMYVIDEKGTLIYRGAIDNAPLGDPQGGGAPVNYVDAALSDMAAGKPVKVNDTRSYGCSVKYSS